MDGSNTNSSNVVDNFDWTPDFTNAPHIDFTIMSDEDKAFLRELGETLAAEAGPVVVPGDIRTFMGLPTTGGATPYQPAEYQPESTTPLSAIPTTIAPELPSTGPSLVHYPDNLPTNGPMMPEPFGVH
ncbi:unnamed protein product, partial [Peniophora sp. CBMAI 1063]